MSPPRESGAALLLAVLLLAAGCTGGPGPGASPTSATPTETPPGTAGGTPAPSTNDGANPTLAPETTTYGTAYTAPNDRVRITSRAETSVTVTVLGPDRETSFERTYGPNAGELDLGGAFALRGSHRIVVASGGEVRWNRTVHEYETYDLLVAANGSVTVESLAEV